jgi:biotin synthase-like enzyme
VDYREIALVTRMKVWATLGEYSPNALGNTRAAMVDTMRCNTER